MTTPCGPDRKAFLLCGGWGDSGEDRAARRQQIAGDRGRGERGCRGRGGRRGRGRRQRGNGAGLDGEVVDVRVPGTFDADVLDRGRERVRHRGDGRAVDRGGDDVVH